MSEEEEEQSEAEENLVSLKEVLNLLHGSQIQSPKDFSSSDGSLTTYVEALHGRLIQILPQLAFSFSLSENGHFLITRNIGEGRETYFFVITNEKDLDDRELLEIASRLPRLEALILVGAFNESDDLVARRIHNFAVEHEGQSFDYVSPTEFAGFLYSEAVESLTGKQDSPTLSAAAIHMMADRPLTPEDEDLLGFGDYANAIFSLIDTPKTTAPLTLAINAKWGTGKSSLAHLIQDRLVNKDETQEEKPHLAYEFNAWMHDDAGDLGTAFIADIVRDCNTRRSWWKRLLRPIPFDLCDLTGKLRRRTAYTMFAFVVAAIAAGVLLANGQQIGEGMGAVGKILLKADNLTWLSLSAFIATLVIWLVRHFFQTAQFLSAYVHEPIHSTTTGSLSRVRRQLNNLIRDVTPKDSKFVVFIDDLERCRDSKAIDVLEVINQLLDFDPVVTVVLADMPAIAAVAEIKYKDLSEKYNPDTSLALTNGVDEKHPYGRLFLQKFIQLQFDLPEIAGPRLSEFIKKLNSQAESTKSDSAQSVESQKEFASEWLAAGHAIDTAFLMNDKPFKENWRQVRRGFQAANPFMQFILILLLPVSLAFTPASTLVKPILSRCNNAAFKDLSNSGMMKLWHVVSTSVLFLAVPPAIYLLPNIDHTETLIMSIGLIVSIAITIVLWPRDYLRTFSKSLIAANERKHEQIRKFIEDDALSDLSEFARTHGIPEHDAKRIATDMKTRDLDSNPEALNSVFDTLATWLPPYPRNIKRVMNRARLTLFMLDKRELLDGDNAVPTEVIAKWVAIQERWPELEKKIRNTPDIITNVEDISTKKHGFSTEGAVNTGYLDEHLPMYKDDEDLVDLLLFGPKIAPHLTPLLHLHAPVVSEG